MSGPRRVRAPGDGTLRRSCAVLFAGQLLYLAVTLAFSGGAPWLELLLAAAVTTFGFLPLAGRSRAFLWATVCYVAGQGVTAALRMALGGSAAAYLVLLLAGHIMCYGHVFLLCRALSQEMGRQGRPVQAARARLIPRVYVLDLIAWPVNLFAASLVPDYAAALGLAVLALVAAANWFYLALLWQCARA